MATGIRATVAFPAEACPIARTAAAAGVSVGSVARSVSPPGTDESVTEFTIDADAPTEFSGGSPGGIDATLIFTDGSIHRYRFTHDGSEDCPCTCLGEFGCAVDRYTVRDGVLTVVFHAADYEQIRAVVAALRERFPGTDIRRLVRSSPDGPDRDAVYVDRGKLTARQLEAVETAYEMGYFERPREANATEVAAALDIDPSTLSEHLAAAQSKLLGDVLDRRS